MYRPARARVTFITRTQAEPNKKIETPARPDPFSSNAQMPVDAFPTWTFSRVIRVRGPRGRMPLVLVVLPNHRYNWLLILSDPDPDPDPSDSVCSKSDKLTASVLPNSRNKKKKDAITSRARRACMRACDKYRDATWLRHSEPKRKIPDGPKDLRCTSNST